LVSLPVDPERIVASAAADSMAELKDLACADAILPLVTHSHAFVSMGALRALKELRREMALVAGDLDPEVRKNSRWALQQIAARKAKGA
jgi:HEAT repeat protein